MRMALIGLLLGGLVLPGCAISNRGGGGGLLGGVNRFLFGDEPAPPPVYYLPPQPPIQVPGAPPPGGGAACGSTGMECMHSHYVCHEQKFVIEVFEAGERPVKLWEDPRYDYLCMGRPENWFVYPPHGEPQPQQ